MKRLIVSVIAVSLLAILVLASCALTGWSYSLTVTNNTGYEIEMAYYSWYGSAGGITLLPGEEYEINITCPNDVDQDYLDVEAEWYTPDYQWYMETVYFNRIGDHSKDVSIH